MYKTILQMIVDHDTIVIHRHKNPDLDALGAQHGLKGLIENNFKNKTVYMVGDDSELNFLGPMDNVEDAVYENALAIIVDVAVSALVSDSRYTLAKQVLVIDHHRNAADINATVYSEPSHVAVCQLLSDMAMHQQLSVDAKTATALFSGLITDSGRFKYAATNGKTFDVASFLLKHGADMHFVYDNLYTEQLHVKKLKGYFIDQFALTDKNVAYMKNTPDVKSRFKVSTFTVSRGMVNQMADIEGVPIWVNFTEDDEGFIQCELRSRKIPVVEVAKKYGGGGHLHACGCTVQNWEMTNQILADLDALIERNEANG